MAYVVGGKAIPYFQASGQGTNFTIPVTPGHQSGDVIYVVVANTSAAGSSMTCSGYTSKGVTTVISSVSRVQAFWKYATSSSEADITIVGQDADFTAEVMIIRGCDQTDPFDTFGNTDFTSNVASQTTGTLTTTANNCLIVTSHFIRTGGKLLPNHTSDMANFVPLCKYSNNILCATLSGYRIKRTAGTTTAVATINNISSTSTGRAFQAAFKDASPSTPTLPPEFSANYEVVKLHMGTTGAGSPTDSFSRNETTTWNDITNMTPTTIDGLTVISSTPTVAQSPFTMPEVDWGWSTVITTSTSAVDATGRWCGASHTVSSVDMTNKIFSITFGMNSLSSAQVGAKGCIIVFEDGSGNWAAFKLSNRQGMQLNYAYTAFIAPGTTTPLDSSGTMDWTDVAKMGYAYHRVTTSTITRGMFIRMAALISEPIVYGGSSAAPINAEFVGRMMTFWGAYGLANAQGSGQIITKGNLTYGDGSTTSYIDLSANSNEQPRLPDGSFENQFWQGDDSILRTRYNLSSNDTLVISRSTLFSPINQLIDHTGSTPATFTSRGATYIKQSGELISGATYTRTTFDQCGQIDLNTALLDTCFVSNSTAAVAIVTNDPSDISNTAFTSAGTGHAIKATATGTFAFEGNTFSGYAGTDGTTGNEAFYNDSGGLITLEIPSGGAVPSIRNGSGASTVIDTPTDNQSVTISGAASGSRIQIYDLTSSTELYNGTPTFPYTWTDSSPYAADREIRLRVAKVGASTAKQFISTTIGTSTETSPALTYLVNQEDDTVYASNAIDGSTVTDVTKNSSTDRFEINKSSGTISAASLYAYEMYYLFTSTGIAADPQVITAVDTANYLVGSSYKFKNVTTGPNVALTITGGWLRDSSTGLSITTVDTTGYTIFNAPDHVVAYATGSGVTPTDITDIADAVWDEALSGHTTAGSAGKTLADASDDADTAANR